VQPTRAVFASGKSQWFLVLVLYFSLGGALNASGKQDTSMLYDLSRRASSDCQ
jgi:hypothetical protein